MATFEGKFRGHYVYHMEDDLPLPTRYVFKQPWKNGILTTFFVNGEQHFTDSKGRKVLSFEDDEEGYDFWAPVRSG